MSSFNLLWATPFFRHDTETTELAQNLSNHLLKCETDGFKKKNSPQREHQDVFESNFDLLTWKHETIQEFRKMLFGYLGGVLKIVNELDEKQLNELQFDNHCWFHITRSGGYFQPHNHPNASWSAIYCVDPGDPNPSIESSSGAVMFQDPRLANAYLDRANRYMRRDMSFDAIRLKLKPAELLIFPSYIYHFVEPYIGEKPRITIAANFWFR